MHRCERRIVDSVRETIGEPSTVAGLVQTQEAMRGSPGIVLNAEQTDALVAHIGLPLTPEQETIVKGRAVRAHMGVTGGELVTADFTSGTYASTSQSAHQDYSYGVQGGMMALPHLETSLIAVTRGDPIRRDLDPAAKWTVIRANASSIAGTGVSISASKAEGEQLAGGLSGQAGAHLGLPGRRTDPRAASVSKGVTPGRFPIRAQRT